MIPSFCPNPPHSKRNINNIKKKKIKKVTAISQSSAKIFFCFLLWYTASTKALVMGLFYMCIVFWQQKAGNRISFC